jgi:hypothetical protein
VKVEKYAKVNGRKGGKRGGVRRRQRRIEEDRSE